MEMYRFSLFRSVLPQNPSNRRQLCCSAHVLFEYLLPIKGRRVNSVARARQVLPRKLQPLICLPMTLCHPRHARGRALRVHASRPLRGARKARAERLPKVRSARAARVWHAVPSHHITNPVSRSHLMAHAHLAHPFAGLSHSSFSADILLGKGKGKRRKVRTQRPQPLRVAPMLPCGLDLCAGRSSLLLGGLPSSWAAFMRSLRARRGPAANFDATCRKTRS